MTLSTPLNWGWLRTFTTLLFIFLGAFGAYLLGMMLLLPRSLFSLMDETTITFLLANISFLIVVGWAFFKFSRLIVYVIFFSGLFLYCKFALGRHYHRGLRNPKVARFQKSSGRRFLRSTDGRVRSAISQLFLAWYFLWVLFFSDATLQKNQMIIFYVVLIVIGSVLSSFRVIEKISHKEFFQLPEGRQFLGLIGICFFVALGALRTSHMLNAKPLTLLNESRSCQVTAMFPVFGGDLYYSPETQNFIVIKSGGSKLILSDSASVSNIPACLLD